MKQIQLYTINLPIQFQIKIAIGGIISFDFLLEPWQCFHLKELTKIVIGKIGGMLNARNLLITAPSFVTFSICLEAALLLKSNNMTGGGDV